MRREIADVMETVKRAKDRDKGCTLLIGAGCSVKAVFPTTNEFVEIIRMEYPRGYERAQVLGLFETGQVTPILVSASP